MSYRTLLGLAASTPALPLPPLPLPFERLPGCRWFWWSDSHWTGFAMKMRISTWWILIELTNMALRFLLIHIRGFLPIFLEQFWIMEHGDPYVWRMKWALSKRLDDIDYSWAWFGGTFLRTETTMWNEFVQRSMLWRRASSTQLLFVGIWWRKDALQQHFFKLKRGRATDYTEWHRLTNEQKKWWCGWCWW